MFSAAPMSAVRACSGFAPARSTSPSTHDRTSPSISGTGRQGRWSRSSQPRRCRSDRATSARRAAPATSCDPRQVIERRADGGTLIVGGGFAGAYVARLLGRDGATIVSPENFMLYTPMLPEAASGTLEPRHTVVPLRQMCPHAELLLGAATTADLDAQSVDVTTQAGDYRVRFDHLVLAPGAVPRTFPIPGLIEHGLGFKTLADAIYLRNHVLRELEGADAETDRLAAQRRLTFVFVGAGYA